MGTPGHTDSQHTHHEVLAACLCPLPCLRHQAWSRDLRRVQGRLTGPCGEADHDASLEEQAGILIATLCPQAPDADACEAGIAKWWAPMAKCLFPEFLGGADVCVRLGLCEAGRHPLVRDWTCEECTDVLAKVAEFIKDQRLLRRESLTSRASAS